MGTGSQFEDASLHQPHSNLHSSVPAAEYTRHHGEELQNTFRPRTAARTSRALPFYAAFAAVLAVIFLAYLCSQSIEKKMAVSLLSRRLANDPDGEGRDGVDKCSLEPLQTKPEPEGPTASKYVVPSKGILGEAKQELGTASAPAAAKRKAVPETAGKGWAKQLRLETPLRAPSPLDPAIDALIDSVLSGMGENISEDIWIADEDPLLSPNDYSIDVAHWKEPCGCEGPLEEAVGQQDLHSGSSTEGMAPEMLLGKEESRISESVLPESSKWVPSGSGEQFAGTTVSHISPSRKTFELQSNVESLTSGARSPFDVVRSQKYLGAPISVETSQWESSGGSASKHPELTAMLRMPADQTPEPFKQLVTTSSEYRSMLSSSGTSTEARPLHYGAPETVLPELEDADEEDEAALGPPTDEGNAYAYMLKNMYNWIADETLQSHPFYWHARSQGQLSTKVFQLPVAISFRQVQKMPLAVMRECRSILKKPLLTVRDFEALVANTERLFGYATGQMDVSGVSRAIKAVFVLGQALLVIDTLYCSAEVLGENSRRHLWWPEVASRIQGARYIHSQSNYTAEKLKWITDLALELNNALDFYSRGIRPPARKLIGLKERLLCNPALRRFQVAAYDPWRADVAQWRARIVFRAPEGRRQTASSTGRS